MLSDFAIFFVYKLSDCNKVSLTIFAKVPKYRSYKNRTNVFHIFRLVVKAANVVFSFFNFFKVVDIMRFIHFSCDAERVGVSILSARS
jgi:hypothetical protein